MDPNHTINASFDVFHKLICIRGYKTIVRIMPHEVHDLEPPSESEAAMMLLKTAQIELPDGAPIPREATATSSAITGHEPDGATAGHSAIPGTHKGP